MLRVTLIELALISAPFVLFILYRALVGARRTAEGGQFDETPYQILFFAGSALSLLALVAVVLFGPEEGGGRGEIYIPPHMENGRLVEGRFISREEAIEAGLIASDEDIEAYYRRTERARGEGSEPLPDPADPGAEPGRELEDDAPHRIPGEAEPGSEFQDEEPGGP